MQLMKCENSTTDQRTCGEEAKENGLKCVKTDGSCYEKVSIQAF